MSPYASPFNKVAPAGEKAPGAWHKEIALPMHRDGNTDAP